METVLKNQDNNEYLRDLAYFGLEKRGLSGQEYYDRIEEELEVIFEADLTNFFLNTSYILAMFRENDVYTSVGRGSVAGSLVCYCLKIHEVDPIKYGLSFARFLNANRAKTGLPDIDSDIGKKDRQKALELMREEFGEDKTFQVINKVRYTPKMVIKDLARVFGVNFTESNRITSLMESNENIEDNEIVLEFLNKYPQIKENYPKVLHLLKNMGIHAGAAIILPDSVENYAGIVKINGANCIDNNGKTCEDEFKFLKNDALGLNTLSIIKDCLEIIGEDIDLPLENLEDPKVYKTINESPLGIFQFEATAGTEYVRELKPDCFNDLVAGTALIRPGAKNTGDAERYVRRKFKKESVEYDHPLLEPILSETYGCLVYQEQVMKIFTDLAKLSDLDADNIRRGISKKKQEVFDEYKPKFFKNCEENGIPEKTAKIIWDKIEKSGEYSFNKSHSVCYSTLSYQTAWLKTYYPIEFYLSMLQNTDDEKKRNKLYTELNKISTIELPDINKSKTTMVKEGDSIYLSFPMIKGVGDKAVADIIEKQPYSSFDDFMDRKNSRKVNKRVVVALIEAGAFDSFGISRESLLNSLKTKREKRERLSEGELLFREFQRLKINPKQDLLSLYDSVDYDVTIKSIKDALNENDAKNIYVKGLISQFDNRRSYTRSALTDNVDSISVSISKQITNRYMDSLKEIGRPVLAKLKIEHGRAYLVSLIDLQNPDLYPEDRLSAEGKSLEKLNEIRDPESIIDIGYVTNPHYFKSKKGNHCCKYDIVLPNGNVLENRLTCMNVPPMFEGSIITFFPSGDGPFVNVYEIVK